MNKTKILLVSRTKQNTMRNATIEELIMLPAIYGES